MKRRSTYLGSGLAAVSALVAVAFLLAGQIQTSSAAGGGPEMRLTAGGCAADCTFANDEKFTLVVEIIEGPASGYVGAQSFIDFGPDLAYDADAAAAADEVVWPDCSAPVALRAQTSPEFVAHGCLTGLVPPLPASTYVGNFLEISLTCSPGSSSTEIRLVPFGDPDAPTSGAAFKLDDLVTDVIPKVSNVSVTCGAGAPADTPTPEGPTATTGPADTPGPTDTPAPATDTPVPPTADPATLIGDANCDGLVDPLDAVIVLQLTAGLLFVLPCPESADMNSDGATNAVDAALILQFHAGLVEAAPPTPTSTPTATSTSSPTPTPTSTPTPMPLLSAAEAIALAYEWLTNDPPGLYALYSGNVIFASCEATWRGDAGVWNVVCTGAIYGKITYSSPLPVCVFDRLRIVVPTSSDDPCWP